MKNVCVNMAFPTLREIKKIIKPTEMFLNLPVYLLHVNHLVHCSCHPANSSRWPGSAVDTSQSLCWTSGEELWGLEN